MRFQIVLHITIFLEDNILRENNEKKKIFWAGNIDISIFYVNTIDNAIETIDGFAKTIYSKNYR